MKTIFRSAHKNHFTLLPNAMLRDKRLSLRARGLLAMILTNAEDWVVTKAWLRDQIIEGREALTGALKELEDCGYLGRVFEQEPGTGRMIGQTLTFSDEPRTRETEKPSVGEPAPKKTIGESEDNGSSEDNLAPEVAEGVHPLSLTGDNRTGLLFLNGDSSSTPPSPVPRTPSPPRKPRPRSPRDDLFDALAALDGAVMPYTKSFSGNIGRVTSEILKAFPDFKALDLPGFVSAYRRKFTNAPVTAAAIGKWLPTLQPSQPKTINPQDM